MGGIYKRGVKRARTGTALAVPKAVKTYVSKRIKASGEKKFLIKSWNATTTTTPNNIHLTSVAQGDDVYQRTGNQIRLANVKIRMGLFSNSTGASAEPVRVIVYKPRDAAAAWLGGPNSFPDPQLHWILYDKMFALSAFTAATGGNLSVPVNLDLKLPGTLCSFDGVTGNDLSTGHLYLYIASGASTNGPIAYGCSEVEFTDK